MKEVIGIVEFNGGYGQYICQAHYNVIKIAEGDEVSLREMIDCKDDECYFCKNLGQMKSYNENLVQKLMDSHDDVLRRLANVED